MSPRTSASRRKASHGSFNRMEYRGYAARSGRALVNPTERTCVILLLAYGALLAGLTWTIQRMSPHNHRSAGDNRFPGRNAAASPSSGSPYETTVDKVICRWTVIIPTSLLATAVAGGAGLLTPCTWLACGWESRMPLMFF